MKHKAFQGEMRDTKYFQRDFHNKYFLVNSDSEYFNWKLIFIFTDHEALHLDALHGEVAVEGGPLPGCVHLAGVLVVLTDGLILMKKCESSDLQISLLVHNPS